MYGNTGYNFYSNSGGDILKFKSPPNPPEVGLKIEFKIISLDAFL